MPIPEGWEDAGDKTPDWAYGAIVYTGDPAMAEDPPSVIAILSKLTGDVDPAEILQLAVGEIHNLPSFDGPSTGKPGKPGDQHTTHMRTAGDPENPYDPRHHPEPAGQSI